ncbi:uncharacterized protein LOC6538882 [Drosophila yakuba]|uniref:Uncharacterized protein n=1 Tax=Drosophila yakuba TaxID=7245 RepID=B4PLW1_DROYA|nr:uncharacterized protein LOC6538882 [Drosophila yakuba]EDW99098.1 uncharacterized protein Dyak_GE23391 [Drosophila yakuba]
MPGEAINTPQSGRRPRLGLSRRGCQSTPLIRLQREDSATITPKGGEQETPRALPLSLSSRRIGLSKNRTGLSKKKLEFAAAQGIKDEEQEAEKKPAKKDNKERCDAPEATNAPDEDQEQGTRKKQLADSPRSSKIIELQGDIQIWHQAFKASVDDLLTMVEPGLSKDDLLTRLGIPHEMLRYLEEECA